MHLETAKMSDEELDEAITVIILNYAINFFDLIYLNNFHLSESFEEIGCFTNCE